MTADRSCTMPIADAVAKAVLADEAAADRRNGIGASDAAAAVGLSRWKTPYELALEKLGMVPPAEENESMEWGKRLEALILDKFRDQRGVEFAGTQERVVHSQYPWMTCTLDARVSLGHKKQLEVTDELVEAKTASERMAEEFGAEGSDQIPEEYVIQCSHQLAVTGAKLVHVPVLIGGNRFRVYRVERNETLIEHLIMSESAFWLQVMQQSPPEPDWRHPSTAKLIASLYGVSGGEIELGDEALGLVDELQKTREIARHHDGEAESLKARLLYLMGDAVLARLSDGRVLTRKQVTRKSYEVKESTYVDLRIRTSKKEKSPW